MPVPESLVVTVILTPLFFFSYESASALIKGATDELPVIFKLLLDVPESDVPESDVPEPDEPELSLPPQEANAAIVPIEIAAIAIAMNFLDFIIFLSPCCFVPIS